MTSPLDCYWENIYCPWSKSYSNVTYDVVLSLCQPPRVYNDTFVCGGAGSIIRCANRKRNAQGKCKSPFVFNCRRRTMIKGTQKRKNNYFSTGTNAMHIAQCDRRSVQAWITVRLLSSVAPLIFSDTIQWCRFPVVRISKFLCFCIPFVRLRTIYYYYSHNRKSSTGVHRSNTERLNAANWGVIIRRNERVYALQVFNRSKS